MQLQTVASGTKVELPITPKTHKPYVFSPLIPLPIPHIFHYRAGPAAGTRVNSDPESLLRFGLPIDNRGEDTLQSLFSF